MENDDTRKSLFLEQHNKWQHKRLITKSISNENRFENAITNWKKRRIVEEALHEATNPFRNRTATQIQSKLDGFLQFSSQLGKCDLKERQASTEAILVCIKTTRKISRSISNDLNSSNEEAKGMWQRIAHEYGILAFIYAQLQPKLKHLSSKYCKPFAASEVDQATFTYIF